MKLLKLTYTVHIAGEGKKDRPIYINPNHLSSIDPIGTVGPPQGCRVLLNTQVSYTVRESAEEIIARGHILNFTDYQLAFMLECILTQCDDGRFIDLPREQQINDLIAELQSELTRRNLDREQVLDWDNTFQFS